MNKRKRLTNEEYFQKLKTVVGNYHFGIHAFGELHDIADAMGWDDINGGGCLHQLWARVCYYTRKCIKAGYPIEEYRIKCCSWSPKETWHPMFRIIEE